MRKPLSPALCVLLTTCNHDPEAYIPYREMAGLSGLSHHGTVSDEEDLTYSGGCNGAEMPWYSFR